MIKRFTIIWILGLFTLVPYGTYYLFFIASRDQYALLITLVLFWLFGYWAVLTPLITALRIRTLMRSIEKMESLDEIKKRIQNKESQDLIVELIASENRIPKFMASRLYDVFVKRFSEADQTTKE